ncbi:MAG: STAS domain-containing protein [Gammaproteobacteria bacterium]|nr:STAS domain-containing protein [Gammaproteobacteria bacterium]
MIALLEARAAGLFKPAHLANNVLAGLVVGIVALPLAMAFAIASGARPEQGLYTAIVAGLITSLFGGTRVQISGPTGAFIAVLAGITSRHGVAGLQLATLMAGFILLAMGLARLGALIKYIPTPVIVGFTTGIGVIIFTGQWQNFFGLHPANSGVHFHTKMAALLQALPQLHRATTALGALTLAILVVAPRWQKRVPAPLIAILVASALQAIFDFEGVATIGSAFGGIPRSLPSVTLPTAHWALLITLVGPAFSIAMLAAIESLLSAVVADGATGTRHDSNQELVAQGLANIAAPLLGGFAATGAIARTATNIRNGATSPLAGVVHCVFLLLVIALLAPLASAIPLCSLSAILFVVAWGMSELPQFLRLCRWAPRADVFVLVLSFGLTVFVDLVVAVNVGVALAAILFVRHTAESVEVAVDPALAAELAPWPREVLVYAIDGPLFYGAAVKLARINDHLQQQPEVRALVLRMGRVPLVDVTGSAALELTLRRCEARGTRVLLAELRPNVQHTLARAGVLGLLDKDDLVATLEAARGRLGAVVLAAPAKPHTHGLGGRI